MHAQIKNAAKAALNNEINPRFERTGDFLSAAAHLSARDQRWVRKKKDFLCTLPLDDNNAVFNLCYRLCCAYEAKAFIDGLQYGVRLLNEIKQLHKLLTVADAVQVFLLIS